MELMDSLLIRSAYTDFICRSQLFIVRNFSSLYVSGKLNEKMYVIVQCNSYRVLCSRVTNGMRDFCMA